MPSPPTCATLPTTNDGNNNNNNNNNNKAQGVVPTETTYVAALVGFEGPAGGNPRMEGAKRAFAAIARTGPPPGTNLLQRTAVAYAHARMWQEAFDMFGSVVR